MVGLKQARSVQDEKLVETIFQTHLFPTSAYSPSTDIVFGATPTNLIVDARPTTNAMANVAKGAGSENMDNYKSGKKVYLGACCHRKHAEAKSMDADLKSCRRLRQASTTYTFVMHFGWTTVDR